MFVEEVLSLVLVGEMFEEVELHLVLKVIPGDPRKKVE